MTTSYLKDGRNGYKIFKSATPVDVVVKHVSRGGHGAHRIHVSHNNPNEPEPHHQVLEVDETSRVFRGITHIVGLNEEGYTNDNSGKEPPEGDYWNELQVTVL